MKSLLRSRKLPSVVLSLFLISVMTGAVAYSPTLYRWFCAATGYGGAVSVKRALQTEPTSPGVGPEITVRFDTNVANDLNWEFKPEQASVVTHVGLPTTVFFHAKNLTNETVIARATYNVTPDSAGYYFTKVQCFCFTEEKLKPGESARMPVVFYVDPEMLTDGDAQSVRTITLSYSFFRQAAGAAETAARSLREGSEKQVEKLKTAKEADFDPPEVRRY
ncbi:MAG TPA: cytochrome c oxidase assembly protein [Parvibaculum sp.]|jgi:cytochrome c oxidase assembly protein subunit 11